MRRRIVVAAVSAGAGIVALAAWGLERLAASVPLHVAMLALVSGLTIFLAFVFSFVLALGAAFLAAPAIAGEVESGIALAILPRPLSRAEYVLGKWMGLAILLAGYAGLIGVLGYAAIALTTGYQPPHPATALVYLVAQGMVMLTLALALSTRLPSVAGGLLAMLAFGVAWIAGIAGTVAASLNNDLVRHGATLVALLVPSDGLWRGALYNLEPVAILAASANAPGVNPFGSGSPPAPAFLVWTCAWTALMLRAAVVSFARRDL